LGFRQLALPSRPSEQIPPAHRAPIAYREEGRNLWVSVAETSYCFHANGSLARLIDNGKEMLDQPMSLNIYRAFTDNDRNIVHEWRRRGFDRAKEKCLNRKITSMSEDRFEMKVTVALCRDGLNRILTADLTYTILTDGILSVHIDVERHCDIAIPRFGVNLVMPAGTESLTYYGMGPGGAYSDFKLSQRRSLFRTTVTENFEHFIRPQENCAHIGTSFVELTSLSGHGLRLRAATTASFNACHYSIATLDAAAHDYELIPDEKTHVQFDYAQSGLGSNSCGPLTREQFRLEEKSFSFDFTIAPFLR